MLLSVLTIQQEPGVMERRFGFRAIRPLEGDAGQERYGVIDRAGGGHAAVLTLRGPQGSLTTPGATRALVDGLADALPDCPVQFLLSRRPVEMTPLLSRWRAGIEHRVGDNPAAGRIWSDLHGSYRRRLEAAGLADLWCGVAVAAADLDQLTARVAGLFTMLPYAATPANAEELSVLVGRLLRPGDRAGAGRAFPLGGERMLDLPGLAPRTLLIGADAVSLTPGMTTSYWQITPPLPQVEGGPLHRLLDFPDLLPYHYDLAIHLRPAATEKTMRTVLDTRLLRLEEELRRRGGAPSSAPGPEAPPDATDTWLLELERREIAARRSGLSGGRERLREATVLLALHLPSDEPAEGPGARAPRGGPGAEAFARALAAAEIPARPVQGRPALGRMVRAILPLAVADGARGFPLPTRQAGELALLPATRPPTAGPVLGLTPEKTLFTAGEEAAGSGHWLVAGGHPVTRRAAARQWAVQSYLSGSDVLIWDPAGAWAGWVDALGGRYVRPGGPLPADRLNLLAAPLGALDQSDVFEAWVRELATLFGLLLPPLTGQDVDAIRSQIGAALLQVGMRSLERADPAGLTLDALHTELRVGGYQASADGVQRIAGGAAGHLFSTAAFADAVPGLVAIGPSDGLKSRPAKLATGIALRHALWHESGLLGPPRPPGPRIVILDGVTTALKHGQLAADLLALARGAPEDRRLWLLPGSDELAPLLAHPAGRALVRPMALFALFGPAGAVPASLELSPGMQALLREARVAESAATRLSLLAPAEALVQTGAESWLIEVVTGALAEGTA
ncbi:MAG TPA: hypothetical protein VM536_11775 [Chloroflexia bacterium]|nr:hypothetical protein [Chloroflexia bacterium]